MRFMSLRLLVLPALVLCYFYGCGGETATSDDLENIDSTTVGLSDTSMIMAENTAEQAPPPPPPEKDEVAKEIIAKQTIQSPFLKLGCCEAVDQRVADCCCEAVLEKYKELRANDDPKIAILKQEDPLLGNCRKMAKWIPLFEAADNPSGEEESLFD